MIPYTRVKHKRTTVLWKTSTVVRECTLYSTGLRYTFTPDPYRSVHVEYKLGVAGALVPFGSRLCERIIQVPEDKSDMDKTGKHPPNSDFNTKTGKHPPNSDFNRQTPAEFKNRHTPAEFRLQH